MFYRQLNLPLKHPKTATGKCLGACDEKGSKQRGVIKLASVIYPALLIY
jgi:hypothetical protein